MADLSVIVFGRGGSVSQIQPPFDVLTRAVTAEALHVTTTLTGRLTPILVSLTETLHVVSNTVSRTWNDTGDVAFFASLDHASVTDYSAQLRTAADATTVIDSLSLGVPTPDGNNVITADLTSLYSGQTAGEYTISILTTTATGSADSAISNAFTLPIV